MALSAKYDAFINASATKHGLDPELLKALILTESGGDPNAVSRKGATGLTQLMDSTVAELGVTDVFNPEQNIEGGAAYLRKMIDKYGGNTTTALAAYNAGPGAVDKHNGIPPFKETKAYVKKVRTLYDKLKAATVTKPSDNGKGVLSWTEVTELPEYLKLKPAERDVQRRAYFADVVQPQLSEGEVDSMFQEFLADTDKDVNESGFVKELGKGLVRFGAVEVPKMVGNLAEMAAIQKHSGYDPALQKQFRDVEGMERGVLAESTGVIAGTERAILETERDQRIISDPLFQTGRRIKANREAYMERHPELKAYFEEFEWNQLVDPRFWGSLLGETLPTAVVAAGTGVGVTVLTKSPAAGMAVSGTMMFGLEGSGAYEEAIESGKSLTEAKNIGLYTGLTNAIIEQASMGPLFKTLGLSKKVASGLKDEIAKKTIKELAKRGSLKNIPATVLEQALYEGFEEIAQEGNTMIAIGQKMSPEEISKRLVVAFLGGLSGGIAVGAVAGAVGVPKARKDLNEMADAYGVDREELIEYAAEGRVTPEEAKPLPEEAAAIAAAKAEQEALEAGELGKVAKPAEGVIEGEIAPEDQLTSTVEQKQNIKDLFKEVGLPENMIGEVAVNILDESDIVRDEQGNFVDVTGKGAKELIDTIESREIETLVDQDMRLATAKQKQELKKLFDEVGLPEDKIEELAVNILDKSEIVRGDRGNFIGITRKGTRKLINDIENREIEALVLEGEAKAKQEAFDKEFDKLLEEEAQEKAIADRATKYDKEFREVAKLVDDGKAGEASTRALSLIDKILEDEREAGAEPQARLDDMVDVLESIEALSEAEPEVKGVRWVTAKRRIAAVEEAKPVAKPAVAPAKAAVAEKAVEPVKAPEVAPVAVKPAEKAEVEPVKPAAEIPSSQAKFIDTLKQSTRKYPDVAEEGKGITVQWADGRGIVFYKNKADAIKFIEQGDREVVKIDYRELEKKELENLQDKFTADKEVAVKPAEAGAKQPWEMTRDEFGNANDVNIERSQLARNREIRLWEKRRSEPNVSQDAIDDAIENVKSQTQFAQEHQSAVKQALSEGKPVPAEVLKDYPDLVKAAEVKPVAKEPLEWNAVVRKYVARIDNAKAEPGALKVTPNVVQAIKDLNDMLFIESRKEVDIAPEDAPALVGYLENAGHVANIITRDETTIVEVYEKGFEPPAITEAVTEPALTLSDEDQAELDALEKEILEANEEKADKPIVNGNGIAGVKTGEAKKLFIADPEMIMIDTDRFQGRIENFAQKTYDKIMEEGWAFESVDPISLWQDPDTDIVYSLSHTRLKVAQDILALAEGRESAELAEYVKKHGLQDKNWEKEGLVVRNNFYAKDLSHLSEEEAIKAALLSNEQAQGETLIDKLKRYRTLEARGQITTTSNLREYFGGDANRIRTLSRLNSKGQFIELLDKAERDKLEGDFPHLRARAMAIAEMRNKYPNQLTDMHEQQLFNWFYVPNKTTKTVEGKSIFLKSDVQRIIEKNMQDEQFTPDRGLLLNKKMAERSTTARIDTKEIEEELVEIEDVLTKVSKGKLKLSTEALYDLGTRKERLLSAKREIISTQGMMSLFEKPGTRDMFEEGKPTLLTEEERAKLDKINKDVRGEFNKLYGGFVPLPTKLLALYVKKGVIYIKAGARTFKNWSRAMSQNDNRVVPYLKQIWESAVKTFNKGVSSDKAIRLTEEGEGEASPVTRRTEEDRDRSRPTVFGRTRSELAKGRPRLRTASERLIPKPKDNPDVDSYRILDEHQNLGAKLALEHLAKPKSKAFLLADSTGTGKTMQLLVIASEYQKQTNKPVLIVTENKQVIETRFKSDARALGINLKNIEIGTYDGLRTRKVGRGNYGLVLYDEAHNLKNSSAQKSIVAQNIQADKELFATATPMDRPTGASYFFSKILNRRPSEVHAALGFRLVARKTLEGVEYSTPELLTGFSWRMVFDNIIEMRDEAIEEGTMVRREYPFYGNVQNITLGGLDANAKTEERIIDEYWESEIARARNPKYRMNLTGQRILDLSRWSELQKLDAIIDMAMQDYADGKYVVIVAEGLNKQTIKGLDEVRPGFLGQFSDFLDAKGIDHAKLFGRRNKSAEVDKFQRGDVKFALATPKSGATGIDLDDVFGNKPRVMYVVTPNFSGDLFQQVLGRVSRRNTKSPSEIRICMMDTISDNRRREIVGRKLKTLESIQKGADVDIAVGMETEVEYITTVSGIIPIPSIGTPITARQKAVTERQEIEDMASETGQTTDEVKVLKADEEKTSKTVSGDDELVLLHAGLTPPEPLTRTVSYLLRQGKGMQQGDVQEVSEKKRHESERIEYEVKNERKVGKNLHLEILQKKAEEFLISHGYAKAGTRNIKLAANVKKSREVRVNALMTGKTSRPMAEAYLDNLNTYLEIKLVRNINRFIENNNIPDLLAAKPTADNPDKPVSISALAEALQDKGIKGNTRGDAEVEIITLRQEISKTKKKSERLKLREQISEIDAQTLEERIRQLIDGGVVATAEEKKALAEIFGIAETEIYPDLSKKWLSEKTGIDEKSPFMDWIVNWRDIRSDSSKKLAGSSQLPDEVRRKIYENAAYVKRNYAIDLLRKMMKIDPGAKSDVVLQVEGSIRASIARFSQRLHRLPEKQRGDFYTYVTSKNQATADAALERIPFAGGYQTRAIALRNTVQYMRKWMNDFRFDPDTNEFQFEEEARAITEAAGEMVDNYISKRTESKKGQPSHGIPIEHILRRTLDSKEFRVMYGEISNPIDRLMFTTEAQAQLINQLAFLKRIGANENEGVVFSAQRNDKLGHTLLIPNNPMRFGEGMAGKYVSRGTYDIMVGDFDFLPGFIKSPGYQGYIKRVRLGKLAGITPMARNFGTSYMMAIICDDMAHGMHYLRLHNKGLKICAKAKLGDRESQKFIEEMIGYGALSKNAQSMVAETQIEIGVDWLDSSTLTHNPAFSGKGWLSKLGRAEKLLLQKAGAAYQFMDTPTKMASYMLHTELNIKQGMSDEAAKMAAAEFVKQHYQYVDRTARVARLGAKMGLTDFKSFPLDAARIYYNAFDTANKELKKGNIRPMVSFAIGTIVSGAIATGMLDWEIEFIAKIFDKLKGKEKDELKYDKAITTDEMASIRHFLPDYWTNAVTNGFYRRDGIPVLVIGDYVSFFTFLNIPASAWQQRDPTVLIDKAWEEIVSGTPGMGPSAIYKLFTGEALSGYTKKGSPGLFALPFGDMPAEEKIEALKRRATEFAQDIGPVIITQPIDLYLAIRAEKTGGKHWIESGEAWQRMCNPVRYRAQDPVVKVEQKVRNDFSKYSKQRSRISKTSKVVDDLNERIKKWEDEGDQTKADAQKRLRAKEFKTLQGYYGSLAKTVVDAIETAHHAKKAFPKHDSVQDFQGRYGGKLGWLIHAEDMRNSLLIAFKSQAQNIEDMGLDYQGYLSTFW